MLTRINWTPGPGDPTILHGTCGPLLIAIEFFIHRYIDGRPLFSMSITRYGEEMVYVDCHNWIDIINWLDQNDTTLQDWMHQ